MSRIPKRFVHVLFPLLLFSSAAAAEEQPPQGEDRGGVHDRARIVFGGYLVSFDTRTRVDAKDGTIGTTITLEDDLGMDSDQLDVRLAGYYAFKRRHRLYLGYLVLRRDSTVTLEEDLQFGDSFFEAGTTVKSDFDTRQFGMHYQYSFLALEKYQAGISFGLSTYWFDWGLKGTSPSSGELVAEQDDFIAPVPLAGLNFAYAIRPGLTLRAFGRFFDFDDDDWIAKLTDTGVFIEHFPGKKRRWGYGLGFDRVDMKYEDLDNPMWKVTYDYSGLFGYGTYAF